MRGATAAWVEDDGSIHLDHAKATLRNTILDMMELRRSRVRNSDASMDELALVAREEIAAAMVRGDCCMTWPKSPQIQIALGSTASSCLDCSSSVLSGPRF